MDNIREFFHVLERFGSGSAGVGVGLGHQCPHGVAVLLGRREAAACDDTSWREGPVS